MSPKNSIIIITIIIDRHSSGTYQHELTYQYEGCELTVVCFDVTCVLH